MSETTRAMTLLRHGESSWNSSRRVQGQNDEARLNDEGRRQAFDAAKALLDLTFGQIISSDLARAHETASIIATPLGLDVMTTPLLRERNFGILEGAPWDDLTGEVTGIVNGVVADPDVAPEGGETFRQVVARAQTFLSWSKERWPLTPILVVTHGGMIRALRAAHESAPLQNMVWDTVGNCSIWTIDESLPRP